MSDDYRTLLRCALRDQALVGWLLALLAGNLVLVALHSAHFICLRYGLEGWRVAVNNRETPRCGFMRPRGAAKAAPL